MMGPFIATNWIALLLAVLIGLITAWSIWGRRARDEDDMDAEIDYDNLDGRPTFTPPVSELAPPPAARATPDNLQLIKGIGPKLSQQLQALGVTRFDQIAAWTPDDITSLDAQLEGFSGRIERDDWVGQAQLLASGFTHEGSSHYAPH